MNEAVVARLVELAEKATPGPWEIHVNPETFRVFLDQPDSIREIEMEPDDAEFMVAAVNEIVPLARDWERLKRIEEDGGRDSVTDWTTNAEGVSNSSREFEEIVHAVERLIRNDALYRLIAGRADATARLIVAQLAHVHHLAPCSPDVVVTLAEDWTRQLETIKTYRLLHSESCRCGACKEADKVIYGDAALDLKEEPE
jgi:hypothetical protein